MKNAVFNLCLSAAFSLASFPAPACTRIVYETGDKSYMVGRAMDWMVDPKTDLWAFPKGMARDGGLAQGGRQMDRQARFGRQLLLQSRDRRRRE